MLSILFTLNLSNIKNNNLLQPENQSWIGTFIKLTHLNLKFASPNCSILKMKDFKQRVINMPPLTYFGAAGMKATMLYYVSAPLAPLRSLLQHLRSFSSSFSLPVTSSASPDSNWRTELLQACTAASSRRTGVRRRHPLVSPNCSSSFPCALPPCPARGPRPRGGAQKLGRARYVLATKVFLFHSVLQ